MYVNAEFFKCITFSCQQMLNVKKDSRSSTENFCILILNVKKLGEAFCNSFQNDENFKNYAYLLFNTYFEGYYIYIFLILLCRIF